MLQRAGRFKPTPATPDLIHVTAPEEQGYA